MIFNDFFFSELRSIRNNNKWVVFFLFILLQLTVFILFELYFFSSVITTSVTTVATGVVSTNVDLQLTTLENIQKTKLIEKFTQMYHCSGN